MRNPELDKKIDLDDKVSELKTDEVGSFRMVNGKKIYQIDEIK